LLGSLVAAVILGILRKKVTE
jgi:hypothetical protein